MEGLETNSKLEQFVEELGVVISAKGKTKQGIVNWALGMNLVGGKFSLNDHEYQKAILEDQHPNQCMKKGSQMGITEIEILRHMYGLISKVYPVGVMVIMPTGDAVSRYVKMRFNPLIEENFAIKNNVVSTDSVDIKKVNKGFLNFVGARATHKVDNVRKSSISAKSTPADALMFDEFDEMDSDMIEMFEKRLGHSSVHHQTKLSTPTVTGYGIELEYEESDQCVWMIRCTRCGSETCLELEFPNCLRETPEGKVYRVCIHCGAHIYPKDGRWVALYPNRTEKRGYWISRLNSKFANLQKILKDFQQKKKLQELYNSELAMGYVPKESELTTAEVFTRCGQEPMQMKHEGPCAMGVDVGKIIHVVVGFKPSDKLFNVCYLARVSTFNDLADIAKRFNVKCGVIDIEPETRKVKEFSKAASYPVYLCDYREAAKDPEWSFGDKTLYIQRTIGMDMTHDLVIGDKLVFPRRCSEVELFARHLASPVKFLKEDKERDTRTYHYRARGEDHYYHALGYFLLAATKVKVYEEMTTEKLLMAMIQRKRQESENQLMHGISGSDNNILTAGL